MPALQNRFFYQLGRRWKLVFGGAAILVVWIITRPAPHAPASPAPAAPDATKSAPTRADAETAHDVQQWAFRESYQRWRTSVAAIPQADKAVIDVESEDDVRGHAVSCAKNAADDDDCHQWEHLNSEPPIPGPYLFARDEQMQKDEDELVPRIRKAMREAAKARTNAAAARLKAIQDADLPETQKESLRKHQIWIGATPEFARLAWGDPEKINRTVTANVESEQWVYSISSYLYFDDGKLTSIQNSN